MEKMRVSNMNQKTVSDKLMIKLNEISNAELSEIYLLISIIKKNINNLINCNMKKISNEFFEKCEYYGKSISEVNFEQVELLNSYKEQFNKIATKFEEEYMNLALELQNAQANQKKSIVEMKKTIDLKGKYIESEEYIKDSENSKNIIEKYNRRIDTLAERYIKYCGLEDACITKLRECNEQIERAINTVMQYEEVNKLAIVEKKTIFNFLLKIFNKFSSKKAD